MGSLDNNTGTATIKGSTSALAIAFGDLKRRFLNQQVELNHVKYNNLQLNTELEHHRNLMHMQERKIIQLKESLKSKSIALDSLEETYKQTRNSENTLLVYLKENECIVNSTITAHQNLQKENQNMKMELKKLAERVDQLNKENRQVTEELNNLRNIPDILVDGSVKRRSVTEETALLAKANLCKNENEVIELLKKQIINLLSEKQTLKTNIHWLTVELNSLKNTNVNSIKRKRNLSETLEEAGGSSFDRTSSLSDGENDPHMSSMLHSGKKLQRFIKHLKFSLKQNTEIIEQLYKKNLMDAKEVVKSKLMEHSFELVDNNIENPVENSASDTLKFVRMNSEDLDIDFVKGNIDIPSAMNESNSSIDILIHKNDSNSSQDCQAISGLSKDCQAISGLSKDCQAISGLSKEVESLALDGKPESSGEHELPQTILDSVQLLQTQTYLTEKILQKSHSSTGDEI